MAFEHPELGDQVAPVLIAGLTDPFDRTRQSAAATLGGLKIQAATPALTPLLHDANPKVG
jgi:HEAT repeat protein